MPLYEYRCEDCGHEFEELVSFSRADLVQCENCGSKNTRRLMSTFCDSGSSDGGPACFPSGGG